MLIFSAFWITLTALAKAAMVMVGAGFAIFALALAIFGVLAVIAAEMMSDVRAGS